jgi:hypothetical protein
MENEKIKEHIQKQNQVKLVLCIATGIIVVALWGIGIIGLISFLIKLLSYPIALAISIFFSFNVACFAGNILAEAKENKIK